ncbi:MAG: GNAT family N-acetyltransferase [Bacteroidota bacterium]|nr:GNAT family N-acetyltransferase [Bacteroidota bacterium]
MQDLQIRKAHPEDASAILNLVMELAIYEKAPEAVHTQEQDYRDGLQNGLFEAFVAESKDNGIIGMALYFPHFSTWNGKTLYLEDFVVSEKFRKSGIGKLLFEAYLEEAKRQGAKMVKWQVLDWNEPAKKFYKKYATVFFPGWENGVILL